MSVETLANDEAADNHDAGRYEDLAETLAALDDVYSVHVHGDRLPPRVEVILDTANVTPEVADRLDEFDAEVVSDSVEVTGRGTITFDVVTPEQFRDAGVRETREYGPASVAFTFTREALELSGIDEDTNLDVKARDGAILLTRHGE